MPILFVYLIRASCKLLMATKESCTYCKLTWPDNLQGALSPFAIRSKHRSCKLLITKVAFIYYQRYSMITLENASRVASWSIKLLGSSDRCIYSWSWLNHILLPNPLKEHLGISEQLCPSLIQGNRIGISETYRLMECTIFCITEQTPLCEYDQ